MLSDYVFQVATPFSTGTGVYLPAHGRVVTNEHVVRDNATVVIGSEKESEQLATVVYLDSYYDLAFLRPSTPFKLPALPLAKELPTAGDPVTAIGQHFGHPIRISDGEVLESEHEHFTSDGTLSGINMYDLHEGKGRALSLPATTLQRSLDRFTSGKGRSAARCFSCREVIFEILLNPKGHCPNCGSELVLPDMLEDYSPTGVPSTIESIITSGGHDARLARRGPNLWSIRQGSAVIQLAYHEDSGLVTGDAYLCSLPELPNADLFAFLLRENYQLPQLTFSTYGRDIILSLLIYDRYLTVETALPRFQELFRKADEYDNILVEEFGGRWLS